MQITTLSPLGLPGQISSFTPKEAADPSGTSLISYERGILGGNTRGVFRGNSMIIQHQKNTARYIAFPLLNSASPEDFLVGAIITKTSYYKDAAGSWTTFVLTDSPSEIGSTGIYEFDITAAEMNHDQLLFKFTAPGAADTAVIIDCRAKLSEDLLDFDATTDSVIVGTNNDKTGYSITGTLTTLDALDTAQDAQHTQTQADVAAVPTAAENADAIWDELQAGHVTVGSFGSYLNDILTNYSTYDPATDQVIVATNNDKTGYSISGTLTTLDALDTVQDTQHATTQADIAALNDPTTAAIAQAVLSQNVSSVEVGMAEHTLGSVVLMALESAAAGNTLTVYRTDGVTTHITKTLGADPNADPVVSIT